MFDEFEWDERKRIANQEKHGIDFYEAAEIFRGKVLVLPGRPIDRAEARHVAIGILGKRELAVVYVVRAGVYRLISARRARKHERRAYYAIFPAQSP